MRGRVIVDLKGPGKGSEGPGGKAVRADTVDDGNGEVNFFSLKTTGLG